MNLSTVLTVDLIFTNLHPLEKNQLLEEVINKICSARAILKEPIVKELILKREELCSTALDNHIAIPHAKIPGIDKTYISLGICNKGADFGSIDGLKTKILIFILHPEETGNNHLEILKSVSSLFSDSEIRKKVIEIEDPNKLLDFIKSNE